MIKTPLSTVIGGAFWTPKATILGGASKTFNQLIKSLFANNKQGFVYDPNDLTTMFQDAAGTVPITGAGQAVGLLLDKSRGLVLGSDVIVNGGFDSVSGWVTGAGRTVAGGVASWDGTSGGTIYQTTTGLVAGDYCEITYTIKNIASGSLRANLGNNFGVARTTAGIYTERLLHGTTANVVGVNTSSAGTVGSIDNISVRKVLGNHAYQPTSSMRPLLAASPQRLDYDTVDDRLITELPTQLTGCTVIRAVPNVGTQILTNQTIPATYNDNTDHCGLIVINRALTATETSQITKLFNKAAGV